MTNSTEKRQELFDRLVAFSLSVISLTKMLPRTEENTIFGKQLIRSSSSIGANYSEALYGHSYNDFLHCMNISRKETSESLYWLILLQKVNSNYNSDIESVKKEATELLKIFIASVKTAKSHNHANSTKS